MIRLTTLPVAAAILALSALLPAPAAAQYGGQPPYANQPYGQQAPQQGGQYGGPPQGGPSYGAPYTPYPGQQPPPPQQGYGPGPVAPAADDGFSSNEIVQVGHKFFGGVSSGLAKLVERAASGYGLPNGYILGQEGSGALIGGVRYGEGTLYTRNAGQHRIYWQGPSIGFDVGGDGSRTMMLVYNLRSVDGLHRRFVGLRGSAYLVGGLAMTVLQADDMAVVPIVSGVGARLGVNLGYLKFTAQPTWNPF